MSKTLQQKLLGGNLRPSRDNVSSISQSVEDVATVNVDYELINEVPKAPDWLPNHHAKKEWNRLAPILVKNKMLTEAGLSAFGMMCSSHGKIVQLFQAGESPNGAMLSCHRTMINDFGLTPVAQGKLKTTPEQKKSNNFARNAAAKRA